MTSTMAVACLSFATAGGLAVGGVYVLTGAGWALIAGAIVSAAFGWLIVRGIR